jgi:TorA maturation chaperone TorD
MFSHDYRQFARLFLLELDQPTRDELSQDERFSAALPSNLQDARVEFTRVFTLSVYPYASVFLELEAAMNGNSTAEVERFYERVGFEIEGEWMVGAPDALGAELACLGWLLERGEETHAREFLRDDILPWAPVCCLAIERSAHLDLYRRLAEVTRAVLLGEGERLGGLDAHRTEWNEPEPEERDLHWVIRYLVAPARCGIFLSKEDLRQIAGCVDIPISFGDRALMLTSLLRGAGLQERIPETLERLQDIVRQWMGHYKAWTLDYPHSALLWNLWLARADKTQTALIEMLQVATQHPAQEE